MNVKSLIPQKLINTSYHLPKAVLASSIHGFPAKKLKIIGVTGTDGKTTTVNMIYHILNSSGKNVSMVSTVNAAIGGKTLDTGAHVSSPEPFALQHLIKKAIQAGSEYLVLEVTSHGLDQHRFWGINFDIGVITNVTHEHLDYHKSFENYLQTKAKLIQNSELAVLNIDDQNYQVLSKLAKQKVVSFGLSKEADVNLKKDPVELKIPGEFNKLNALAATAVCLNLGLKFDQIQKALSSFVSPSGRMEKIPNKLGLNIVIDFAHTPNGLENAMNTLKSENDGKLIAVFGAASKRDVYKRPIMGEIAGKLADFVVLTAEDPRGESIQDICIEIAKGAVKAGVEMDKNLFIIEDRQKAINFVINKLAKRGDTVGIFGKGHEQTMNLDGKKEIPWSDHQAVESALHG